MMRSLDQAISAQLKMVPVEKLLEEAAHEDLNPWDRENLRLIGRDYVRHRATPDTLAQELNAVAFAGRSLWARAKAENNWALMQPVFSDIIAAERKKIKLLADKLGIQPYEVCLFDFVRGYTTASLEDIMVWAMTRLSPRVKARQPSKPVNLPRISDAKQLRICQALLDGLGFDFMRGRLDISSKAFHIATDEDSRIGLKPVPNNIWATISSAVHEMGHSMHRLHCPRNYVAQPVGSPGDFALREAMAFIWQVHAARTPEFISHTALVIRDIAKKDIAPQELYDVAWAPTRGPERSRADPAAYLLHIGIRMQLEQELLIEGRDVATVPRRWAELYDQWLGVEVPDNASGCLQDIHWYKGAFGYFPAYALGHMYAAALMQKAESELPELRLSLGGGIGHPLAAWLQSNIYQYANLQSGRMTVENALDAPLNVDGFLDRLIK
ncbi:MAG: Thermostable carboxypeptidase 1 [Alphaproteobacteria bacterium]|nr:Thermostable carboxypeptidase 1 [Alphaproteobacteria bacterium]